jgi:hypothetical protein
LVVEGINIVGTATVVGGSGDGIKLVGEATIALVGGSCTLVGETGTGLTTGEVGGKGGTVIVGETVVT